MIIGLVTPLARRHKAFLLQRDHIEFQSAINLPTAAEI